MITISKLLRKGLQSKLSPDKVYQGKRHESTCPRKLVLEKHSTLSNIQFAGCADTEQLKHYSQNAGGDLLRQAGVLRYIVYSYQKWIATYLKHIVHY